MANRLAWQSPAVRPRLALAAALALALAVSAPAPAAPGSPTTPAASLDVTTLADEHDLTGVGTGCALREAIVAANTDSAFGGCPAGSGADRIGLPSGTYTLTLAGANEDLAATGDLDIRGALTIAGASAASTIIHGNGLDRVLDISGTVPVEVSGLSLTGGSVGASFGAGILNRGSALTLTHTAVLSNVSLVSTGGIVNIGGALVIAHSEIRGNSLGSLHNFSGGSLQLVDSLVQGNFSGLTLGGQVVIRSSQILSNTGSVAGLTFVGVISDTARVENSTISFNPGGVYNGGSGQVTVVGSTLSHNTGTGLRNTSALARTVVRNSTLSGNQLLGINADNGSFELYNVTLANNSSGAFDGGGLRAAGAAVSLQNTLIAGNTDPGGQAPDCSGTLTSLGYNLIQSAQGCTLTGTSAGNVLNQPASLAPLQDNGGPTQTHALLAGSLAINAGDPAGCGDGQGGLLLVDQRGYDRVGRCDIGAFEFGAQPLWLLLVPLVSK